MQKFLCSRSLRLIYVILCNMISAVILTKNNQRTIEKVLSSLENFEDIVVLDTGSSDDTLKIVKNFKNVRIFKSEFSSFGKMRNKVASLAKNDWVLAIDSDEIITKELENEIFNLKFENDTVYSIPFLNYFNEKLIKCCGWYPESHARLYNKNTTHFHESQVHESLNVKNLKTCPLNNYIKHYSYGSIDDFLRKMQIYSTLFAKENKNKKKASVFTAVFHSLFAFFKSYFLKLGIFGGKEGFIISIYNANTALYKYLKLEEENKKN